MAEDQAAEAQVMPGRDVFISYASQDKAVAETVCKALESAGLACWIAPRDVIPGESFAAAIVHAIDATKVIVLVLSEHAAGSQHVLREVERATSKRHAVIAFRLDVKPLPADFEYFLNTSQWLDASAAGVRRALPKLVEAVRGATSQSAVPAPVERAIQARESRAPRRRWLVGAGMVGALAILVVAYITHRRWGTPAPEPRAANSIAVLPLANESGDSSQQYFSDGLSENLITALTQFPGLKVIGRTSSFLFRNSKEDAHSIGAKLGVARLLEGSVQRSGDIVRVSTELIDTADSSTKWSERYDRPYKDLFSLQDDITRAVAGALRAKLLPGEHAAAQSERPPGGSLEAYNALLQGRFYENHHTEADTRKAIRFFTQATQLDSGYAVAWSALSGGWDRLGSEFLEDEAASREAFAKGRQAADHALTLSPDLAAAHIARASLRIDADLDWPGAVAEVRRAIELAPNDGEVKAAYSNQLAISGDTGRAIELIQEALVTDPLRADWYFNLATYLSGLNRLDEAEGAVRRAIELQPDGVSRYWTLATIEVQRGNVQAALDAAKSEVAGVWQDIAVTMALQIGRDRTAADAALRTLIEKHAKSSAYDIAEIYALRNDPDSTFEWLDRAWSQRDSDIWYLHFDPFILRFKSDPRFAAFCRKVGLPVPGERRLTS